MARTEGCAAGNRAAIVGTTVVQPRIETEGATGQIERGTEAQTADEMLELFGTRFTAAL